MTNNIAIAYGCVIENAVGGGGIDTLYGNTATNRLDGGNGGDVLWGYGGGDTLIGGAGNDTLDGGDGEDTAVFSGSFSSYTIAYNASSATFSISAATTGTDLVSGVEFFQFDDLLRSSSQVVSSDIAAPALTSLSPADNATAVSPTANLVLGFSETVQAGSGNFVIHNANGSVARTIAITDTSQVTIAGSTVTINPSADLASGSSYYVNLAAGVLKDLAGNSFAGIAGATTYNFTTAAAGLGDDFPWSTSTSGVVAVNGVASRGTINFVDDSDLFKVTLTAGTTYVFDLTRVTGGLSDPFLELYGSTMSRITSDNDSGGSGNARINYTAGTSGTYYLGAYDATSTGTGAYSVSAKTFGDDFPWSTDTEGVVAVNGAATGGAIETSDDLDLFKVTLTAGTTYVFRLDRAANGLSDPYLQLWNPAVELVAFDDDGGGNKNSLITYTATTSGTYYLGALDYADGTGAYAVSASTIDAQTPTLTSLSPADNATAVSPTANLVLGFSETVQAGSGNFVIHNANGSVARTIAVTDSSQVTIAGSTVTINPSADLASGSGYYVNIAAGVLKDLAGNSFAGIAGATTYNFTTVAAVYADDFPWATNTNGVVTVNGTGARGMIEAVDDADLFKVTLVASASYVFNLARATTDGLSDPYLQLWDSSVELVAFDDNSGAAGNARITYKATAGGTYYLGAWDYGPGTGAYTLSAANIGTNGNDMLTGTVDGDSLFGFAGHDTLDGGGGADSMGGGTGNDTYVVDDAGDIVAEKPGEGIDSVRSSISVTLSADVENLILTGSGDIDGSGNGLANSIAGNPVNNILDGRGGADILIGDAGNDSLDGGESDGKADLLNGGAGNDTYKVGAGDTVVEKTVAGADAGGTDSVQTALASYVLGIYLENLTYTGALAFTGTGNALANSLTGGSGNDKLYGMVGDDTLTGGNGNDSLSGGDILGNVGSDTVILSGNLADYLFSRVTGDSITLNRVVTVTHKTSGEKDTLTGIEKVVFADTPAGRLLNGLPKSDAQTDDGLLLNSASPFNDTYVDDETKTTDNDFDGGAGDDSITGGTSVNTLAGGLGKDTLIGGAGNDTLNGGDGNDSLDGGTGDDSLTGGKGDDVYVVDADGDVVSESLAQGSDTVRTTLAGYNLTDKAANVEKLIYDGTANFTGSGNALANTITGNIGNDILDGGENDGKADLLNGGAGDDTYKVGAGDTVIEKTAAGVDAGGTDSVQTALASYVLGLYLENLAHPGTLNFTGTGNALNNSLTGGSGNDKLYGMLGDDALIGGEGNDSLNGGAGNDTLNGGAGNDTLFGGIGDADVAMFSGTADQYRVSRSGLGYAVSGVDGADYLDGIELLRFGDGAPTAIASFLASPQRQLLDLPGHMLSAMIYPATDAARWNAGSPLGAAVTLTYSFMQSIPSYSFAGEHPGFLPMTAVQRSAVVSVLDYYSKVANLTFVEVTDRGGGGQLRFGTDRQTGSTAYAFAPNLTDPAGGDIWLANNQSSNSTFEAGGYGLSTLLHEVGHALGLKHPGNYGSGDVAPFLPADEDTTRHTVMSYNERADGKVVEITGTQASYTHTILDWSAETAMPYDVAAIQYLYGANVAATNNRYTFPTDRAFFATLWDGGGVDVIDCSTFSRTCLIDLNDGAYSSIGKYASPYDMLPPWYAGASVPTYTGQDNLAIAYGATIENAIGGSAGDVLIGSEIANTLAGGAGNDTLTGGAGADVFHFDVAPNAADNIDVLTDFAAGIDKILLDADAFAGLGPTLGGAFHAGGDVLAAIEADDRILYDTTTGFLYYDADGSGATAAIKFALIGAGAHPTLAAADFMLG
jgi:Ca2+-binding RTX toxin-like protein/methionine-rich copper-binding protein CopC